MFLGFKSGSKDQRWMTELFCEMCLSVKMYMFSKCVVISVIKLLNVMFMLNV